MEKENATEIAFFAGGCFWGVEYLMRKEVGVVGVEAGYMGGNIENPAYEDVCTGNTGHAETVRVVFDPAKISYERLAKLFFEIHDPEQVNRQGVDVGTQYRSEIFFTTENQKEIAEKLILVLQQKGYNIATRLTPASVFWKAEEYHQNYYHNKGTLPSCHAYKRRF
jgi:peptide methionine sulfoxide reductase msrA/msrB